MTTLVRGANPIWFMNNLTGSPINDTYYAFFLQNTLPYLPQTVYQDPGAAAAWSNPIEFQASGGLPNNIFGDPSLVYRIEIRQGPTQAYPLIWLIENYIFGSGSTNVISDLLTISPNIITNPQFSDLFIPATYTYTQAGSGTYILEIAPGWGLILTGAGTTTITQGTVSGETSSTLPVIPGNPPYYISITNSGWTTASLIQTFANNGAIFANGALAISFEAFATTNNQPLTVNYVPSTGASTTLYSGLIFTGDLNTYGGAANIPPSTNTDTGGNAFTNIVFVLPPTGEISFTNIQLTGQNANLSAAFVYPINPGSLGSIPGFQQQTYAEIVNNEFNIYRNSIIFMPKESILTGWNFGLNPWQINVSTATTIAANQYTADQTIMIQQNYVQNNVGSNVSTSAGGFATNGGFTVTAITAHNQFGILQWIDSNTVLPYWGSVMSSLVKASFTTVNSTVPPSVKMRLVYKAAVPAYGSTARAVPVASWTEGGDPVFAAGYTGIMPLNDPAYPLNSGSAFSFDGFVLPSATNGFETLGIFLYTVGDMVQTGTPDYVTINDVSLAPNTFAIASNVKTKDQVIRECQFYFETSYNQGNVPGSTGSLALGALMRYQTALFDGTSTWNIYQTGFDFEYNTVKRASPASVLLYSPSAGTVNEVDVNVFYNSTTPIAGPTATTVANWSTGKLGNKSTQFYPATNNAIGTTGTGYSATQYVSGMIQFHFAADSRIG